MSHVRQQIREAAATLLTGLATSGARVFQSRVRPLKDADLPGLLVTTDDETVTTEGLSNNALQQRELKLVVRAVAKVSATLDDTLDTMLAEIEVALANQQLSGKCDSIQLESIAIEMNDETDKPVGIATATFAVSYFTATGAPSVAL